MGVGVDTGRPVAENPLMSMRLGVRWVGALSGLLGAVVVARAQEQPATPPASVPSQTAPQPEAKPEAKPEPHPESDRPLIPSGPDDSDLGPDVLGWVIERISGQSLDQQSEHA